MYLENKLALPQGTQEKAIKTLMLLPMWEKMLHGKYQSYRSAKLDCSTAVTTQASPSHLCFWNLNRGQGCIPERTSN